MKKGLLLVTIFFIVSMNASGLASYQPPEYEFGTSFNITVGTTAVETTTNISGFWEFRAIESAGSPSKVYISYDDSGVATPCIFINTDTGDSYVTEFLDSGDSLYLLSDSGTCNIVGIVRTIR